MSKFTNHRPPHIYEDNQFYFITGATLNHKKLLNTSDRKNLFIKKLKQTLSFYKFLLFAYVILDNHYHLILKTSLGIDLPKFIAKLHGDVALSLNKFDNTLGRKVFYQYWDYCPRSPKEDPFKDLNYHINYLHFNPIKHGYVIVGGDPFKTVDNQIIIPQTEMINVNSTLKRYKFSSFNSFLEKYGDDAMNDLWRRYPIKAGLVFDNF